MGTRARPPGRTATSVRRTPSVATSTVTTSVRAPADTYSFLHPPVMMSQGSGRVVRSHVGTLSTCRRHLTVQRDRSFPLSFPYPPRGGTEW